jgi:hypothetical protein
MPKQNSIIHLSGRLGNQVYYYRKDKKNRKQYLIRRAPETVQQTTATKRAATDFGIASKSSSLIRNALREHIRDNTLHYRLNSIMGKILRADGKQMFTANNLQSLRNFQFNSKRNIHQLLKDTTVIEKTDPGNLCISFSGKSINNSPLSIKAIGLSVNFTKHITRQVISETIVIKQGEAYTPINLRLKANSKDITLIILEVQTQTSIYALDIIAVIPPQEQPQKKQNKYRSKAPKIWTIPPYPAPVKMMRVVVYNSLPEG